MTNAKGRPPAEDERYYRLDNSAVFTASIASRATPLVFRLECVLDRAIYLPAMQAALEALVPRFPALFVELRRGVFWHYLEPISRPRVEAEGPSPAAPLPYRRGRHLCRVIAYGPRLALEFHHAVTDGTGAFALMKALVAEYLALLNLERRPEPGRLDLAVPGEGPRPGEEEDAYARYFSQGSVMPAKPRRAYMPPGERSRDSYRVILARMPSDELLQAAKRLRVSATEFLAACYLDALQEIYAADPGRRTTLSVRVPVNLRRMYPSETVRNFFLCVDVGIDLRLGRWGFEEIASHVHHVMRLGLEEKEIAKMIRRNVGGERNVLARPMVLPLKTVLLRLINANIGRISASGSLSNLGALEIPEPWGRYALDFNVTLPRDHITGLNIAVSSWRGRTTLCLASVIKNRELERALCGRLRAAGITLTLSSNEPYPDEGDDEGGLR